MRYYETWFGNHPMMYCSGGKRAPRQYWMHMTLEVFTGQLVPMHRKNPDGSIDVLGAQIERMGGAVVGTKYREGLQLSLVRYAERIEELGAKVIYRSKNKLKARYKAETITFEIKPTSVYK